MNPHLKQFLTAIIMLSLFGGFVYYLYKHRDITPPEKNEIWCSAIQYFDKSKSSFSNQNKLSTFYSDSLVNFTSPDGIVYWAKDFASIEDRVNEDGVSYEDVTLKNGTRYMVLQISQGGCKSKAIEDSLYNELTKPDDDNN